MPHSNRPLPTKAELLSDYIYTYVRGMRNPPTFGPHDTQQWKSFEVVVDNVVEPNQMEKVYLNAMIYNPGGDPIIYGIPRMDVKKITDYLSFRKFIRPKRDYSGRRQNDEHSEVVRISEDPNVEEILENTPIYKYEGPTEPHRKKRDQYGHIWYEFKSTDVPDFKLHFNRGAEKTPQELGVIIREKYNLANRNNLPTRRVASNARNSITGYPISDGNVMVNFHGRHNQRKYMKRNTFRNRLAYKNTYKKNPNNNTRNIKKENITLYRAVKPGLYNNSENVGVKNVPHNATNALSLEDIEEGDEMVNFLGEHGFGHYYKKSTFNSPYMPIRQGETYKRHPLRHPWRGEAVTFIQPDNVKIYRAHKLPEPPAPAPAPAPSSNSNNTNKNNTNKNSNNNSTHNQSNRSRNNTRKNNSSPGIMGRIRGLFGF